MLRSNLIGTLVAATSLGAGIAHAAEPTWVDLEPPTITLVAPGELPHRPLRYDLPAGLEQSIKRVQAYEFTAKMAIGGGREDEGQLTMSIGTRSVPPTGDAPIEIVAVLAKIGGPQGSGEGVRGSGKVRFDARGRAVQARWDEPAEGATVDAVLLERFQARMGEIATPLPEEPIGVGGRWEISQSIELGGGRFVIIADCTLVADTPSGLDIECRFRHQAQGAMFTIGEGDRAKDVELKKSSVDGQALILQALDMLAPLREDGDMRTYFEVKTRVGPFPVKMKVDTAERWNQVGAELIE